MIKKLPVLFILFSVLSGLQAQELREFQIKEASPPSSPAVFVNYPNDAAIIIYTAISDLNFESNTGGIIKQITDLNKYTLIITTERQYIKLKHRQFREDRISVPVQKARDVRYYEISAKGSDLDKIPFTIITEPSEAEIYIDDKFMGVKETHQTDIGLREIRIRKEGYFDLDTNVQVDKSNPLLRVTLKKQVSLKVQIQTEPQGAYMFLDGKRTDGETDKVLFIPAGEHTLKLMKPGYLDTNTVIFVKPNSNNTFAYNLVKNEALLEIKILPADAIITIDNELKVPGLIALSPGVHYIDVLKAGYIRQTDTLDIKLGTKTAKNYDLVKNAATLIVSIDPYDAEFKIDQVKRSTGEIEITPGVRIIEVTKKLYLSIVDTINAQIGKTIRKNYTLEKNTGILRLASNQSEFDLKIEDQTVDFEESKELPAGIYSVRADKPGFYSFLDRIVVTRGQAISLFINLKPIVGGLQVSVSPMSTKITLFTGEEAQYSWQGGVQDDSIKAGKYRLTATAEGYEEYSEDITITERRVTEKNINLKRKLTAAELEKLQGGRLYINSVPSIAVIKVYRDGKLLASRQGTWLDSLAKGSYDVTAELYGYETYEDEVDVSTGELTELEIQLKKIDLTKTTAPKWYTQWYYYAGGAVLTGGIVAYLLLRNGDDTQTREAIVDPPGRP